MLQVVVIENLIVTFLKQSAKISKNRIFEPIEQGGLGLTNPELFIKSLKVNIFLKGIKSPDIWGSELRSFTDFFNNPLILANTLER